MADLLNLLDDLVDDNDDDNYNDEEEAIVADADDNNNNNNNNNNNHENNESTTTNDTVQQQRQRQRHAQIPAVLVELERTKQLSKYSTNDSNENNDTVDFSKYASSTVNVNKQKKQQQEQLSPSVSVSISIYNQLKNWWIQELHCPELLYYNKQLITNIYTTIRQQQLVIDELLSLNSSTNNNNSTIISSFVTSIIRIDLERLKFLLCDLYKLRLNKLQIYSSHYYLSINNEQEDEEENSTNQQSLLSPTEKQFVQDYCTIVQQHYERTVTNHIPQRVFRNLYETNMIVQPNYNTYVIVSCINDTVHVPISTASTNTSNDDTDDIDTNDKISDTTTTTTTTTTQHNKDDFLIVQYKQIRSNYLRGDVQMAL